MSQSSESGPPTAVLVDDNLMFALMVEGSLKRCGYRVISLTGGSELRRAVEDTAPDLVLVNLTSRRFDAHELVRAIRDSQELSQVRVIGYAGHVEREYFQSGKEAGADLVVPNSSLKSSLPEVLAKLTRRSEGAD